MEDRIALSTALATENVIESSTHPIEAIVPARLVSPLRETDVALLVTTPTTALAHSLVHKESGEISKPDLGSNKFASLSTLEEKEDSSDSDTECDCMDRMTPLRKRMLRERPVKPSTKAKEKQWQPIVHGRGNRGHRNQRGRGNLKP